MKKNPFKIAGLGEILWDVYEDAKYLGGAPANFAIHCQQLGEEGIIASRVGADPPGQEIITELRSRDLTTEYIQTDKKNSTGTVNVTLDKLGKPTFECSVDVAFDYLEMDDKLSELADTADAVLFGTLAQRHARTRDTIHAFLASAKTAFKMYDVNIRGWDNSTQAIVEKSLELANAIKLNDDELAILKKSWHKKMDDVSFLIFLINEFNLKLIALTLGSDGCILLDAHDMARESGIKIVPKDTTGCGDAFAAALMHQYLQGASLKDMAKFSNALGAFVAQFAGATPAYSKEEFERFLNSQKIG